MADVYRTHWRRRAQQRRAWIGTRAGGVVKTLSAAPTGVTSVAATLVRVQARTAASTGVATVSATLVRDRARSTAATGTATVTASVVRIRARTAVLAGSALVSASVVRVRARNATSTGVATVTVSLVLDEARTAGIDGVATVSAAVVRDRALVASSTGVATVTGDIAQAAQPTVIQLGGMLIPVIPRVKHFEPLARDLYLEARAAGRATVRAQLAVTPFTDNIEALFNDLETFLAFELEPA